MELRAELMPSTLDEARVSRLGQLAGWIDGARPGQWEDWLAEFNREAGTSLDWIDFQGVYGGMEHEEFVRNILVEQTIKPIPDITRNEYLEVIRRLLHGHGAEHEEYFWMKLLEVNLQDPMISALFYWPGEYFG